MPPHPDNIGHAFAKIRKRVKVASDIHLHWLRHFDATQIDSVISEAQKQVRLGWSTVQMAGHYTDGVPEEDRQSADPLVGGLIGPDATSGARWRDLSRRTATGPRARL